MSLRCWRVPMTRKETRRKEKGGIQAQRVKHPTPSQAINALIGDEEQNRKQKRKKKTRRMSPTQRLLRRAGIIGWDYFFSSSRRFRSTLHETSKCISRLNYYYYYLRQHSKVLYHWRVRKRGNMGKHGKVRVKRKWWGLAQSPYSPQGNGRQSLSSKAGRTSLTARAFQIHSHKIRITQ